MWGQTPRARFPLESEQILAEVGAWMAQNGESIYGCVTRICPSREWGRYTQKGNRLYAHVFERGIGPVNFRGLRGKIKKARLLANGSELKLDTSWVTTDYPDDAFIDFPTSKLPDELDTVIELELM